MDIAYMLIDDIFIIKRRPYKLAVIEKRNVKLKDTKNRPSVFKLRCVKIFLISSSDARKDNKFIIGMYR